LELKLEEKKKKEKEIENGPELSPLPLFLKLTGGEEAVILLNKG